MSKGFAYYNTDTNRYQDMRIKRLRREMGCTGIAVYDYVLCEIYRVNGCYTEWNEETAYDVADYFSISEELANQAIDCCCKVGLFEKIQRENEVVLTSKSIQQRYVDMCNRAKRKNRDIPSDVSKLPEETPKLPEETVKVPEEMVKTPEDSNRVEYSRVEYSRVEKKKEEENISLSVSLSGESDTAEEKRERDGVFMIFFFKNFVDPNRETERFWQHYQATNWKRGNVKITDKIALAAAWVEDKAAAIEPRKFRKEFIEVWRKFYFNVKSAYGEDVAKKLITEIDKADYCQAEITLYGSKAMVDTTENNIELLRPLLAAATAVKYKARRV